MGDRTATIAAENISSLSDLVPSHPPTLASFAIAIVAQSIVPARSHWLALVALVYFKCNLLLLDQIPQLCDRHIQRRRQFYQSTDVSHCHTGRSGITFNCIVGDPGAIGYFL